MPPDLEVERMAESGEPKKKRPTPKQLRVVFDTNALFTQSASDLVRQEIAALIESSAYPDLQISWYLPEIVRHERQYQMQTKALEWWQAVPKLERILEHPLNITEELVIEKVNKVVEKRCQTLGLLDLLGVCRR
jgi:hypothetical protein